MAERKIALCFFGITRSLSHTIGSIRRNVIDPAKSLGAVRIYSHFFLQKEVINPRSQEYGEYDLSEHRLLQSDWLELEEPDACLDVWGFERLKPYGDSWQDDFQSLRNLIHQLHSMRAAATAALADMPDVCVFCRPDLLYHDHLGYAIDTALDRKEPLVQVPYWQASGGTNDRFAICSGTEAIRAYGTRITLLEDLYATSETPPNSERLLHHALTRNAIPVQKMGLRASRVRIDGTKKYEDFSRPWMRQVKLAVRPPIQLLADSLGTRDAVRSVLKRVRP